MKLEIVLGYRFTHEYHRMEDSAKSLSVLKIVQIYMKSIPLLQRFLFFFSKKGQIHCLCNILFHRDTPTENLTQHFSIIHRVISNTGKFKS